MIAERRPRGFTLIELLVVVSIIAVLAGILFPVFTQAREKARGIACVSNARQFGMAYAMYFQDWDETLLPFRSTTPTFDATWMHLLYPYAPSIDVFHCSSSRQRWWGPQRSGGSSAYGYNGLMLGRRRLAEIGKSAATLAFADVVPPASITRYTLGIRPHNTPFWSVQTLGDDELTEYRHLGLTTVIFVDGHVKAMRQGVLEETAPIEDGVPLDRHTQFILWNRI